MSRRSSSFGLRDKRGRSCRCRRRVHTARHRKTRPSCNRSWSDSNRRTCMARNHRRNRRQSPHRSGRRRCTTERSHSRPMTAWRRCLLAHRAVARSTQRPIRTAQRPAQRAGPRRLLRRHKRTAGTSQPAGAAWQGDFHEPCLWEPPNHRWLQGQGEVPSPSRVGTRGREALPAYLGGDTCGRAAPRPSSNSARRWYTPPA